MAPSPPRCEDFITLDIICSVTPGLLLPLLRNSSFNVLIPVESEVDV